jgi:hypothetical protein
VRDGKSLRKVYRATPPGSGVAVLDRGKKILEATKIQDIRTSCIDPGLAVVVKRRNTK